LRSTSLMMALLVNKFLRARQHVSPMAPTKQPKVVSHSWRSATPTGRPSPGTTDGPAHMIVVDDPDDPRVAPFRLNERGLANRLQRRDDGGDGLFMAEGDLVVERALEAGCVPVMALVDAAKPPPLTERLEAMVPVYAGGDRMRQSITQLGMPYSVVALFERPARSTVDQLAATEPRFSLLRARFRLFGTDIVKSSVRRAQQQGYAAELDADHIALAIALLFERFTSVSLAEGLSDEAAITALSTIWKKTLYGHLKEN